ncbi:MAG: hypothetical protein M5T52_20335 [Ignavibacteriaceae bacterium]|nr:hypothetical protein [Ignavibacteriaceae bacterium]
MDKEFLSEFSKERYFRSYKSKGWYCKNLLEKVLENKIGNTLDNFSMSLFESFYKVRYKNYNQEEFKLAFKSSKKESKHHPKFFQKKVLTEFESKLKSIEDKLKVFQ